MRHTSDSLNHVPSSARGEVGQGWGREGVEWEGREDAEAKSGLPDGVGERDTRAADGSRARVTSWKEAGATQVVAVGEKRSEGHGARMSEGGDGGARGKRRRRGRTRG